LILEENSLLALYIPATNNAFVFRVKSIANRDRTRIDYGPLPIPKNTPLASYVGGVVPAPADGVMPLYTYVPNELALTFPMPGAYDETDMWYLPKDYRERLFHVIAEVTPAWLRCEVTVPRGVPQGRFQRDRMTVGLEKAFGYARGRLETVHLPELKYGYRFGNDSNLNVYTGVRFTYGEYVVEIPKDPELIFSVLSRRVAVKWVTMPINVYDDTVRRAIVETYGIEGFPVYGFWMRDRAIPEYRSLLGRCLV